MAEGLSQPRHFEIERDRFGYMVTPVIEVGECFRVVEDDGSLDRALDHLEAVITNENAGAIMRAKVFLRERGRFGGDDD